MTIDKAIFEMANLTNLTVITRFDGTFIIQSNNWGCPIIAQDIESKQELLFILTSEKLYQNEVN